MTVTLIKGVVILDQVLSFQPDFIQHRLTYAGLYPNDRAYNPTAHRFERRKMM